MGFVVLMCGSGEGSAVGGVLAVVSGVVGCRMW